jgi:hypothetical protein
MARIAFKAAIRPVGFDASYAVDPAGKAAAAIAAAAAVTADATVAGNPTALGLAEASDAAAAAVAASVAEDLVVSVDVAEITTISKLEEAFRAIVLEARGSGKFAA